MHSRLFAMVSILVLAVPAIGFGAEPQVKVLLICKDRDHPPATHEYMADCELLARCLRQTAGVEAVVSNGWPTDPTALKDVKALVLITRNGGNVLLGGPQRRQVEELLRNGVGLTAIHWGTGAAKDVGEAWQQTLGGWFSTDFSKYLVRTAKLEQADAKHPICSGWKEFEMRDEYYIQLKFQPGAHPVMKAVIEDKPYVLGWTYERPESKGGRSFGFVCGHFHANYREKPFRQAVINGILWTAAVEIPQGGAPCEIVPKDLELPPDARPKK